MSWEHTNRHIPNWKDCIQELYCVLKPNGEVILEELSIDTLLQNKKTTMEEVSALCIMSILKLKG